MKDVRRSGRMPAYLIYIFLWLFFLIIPVITNNYWSRGDIVRIKYDWLRLLPFFLVFLVNNVVLLPRILFRGYSKLYLLSLLVTASLVTAAFQVTGQEIFRNDPDVIEQRLLQDPQYGREEMRPGSPPSELPGNTEIFKSPAGTRGRPALYPALYQMINTFFISLLVAGFNTAIAVTNRWVAEEQARKEAEKEQVKTELAFLQNQVSPHFFMNTLNNIHALVDADHELAQDAILKLSGLMRYLLYESGRGATTLKKEIEFLKSYINLMELRVDSSVEIIADLPEKINDVKIPPLLFISFIENAFKHGISYREKSSLRFRLVQHENSIEFTSENTIPLHADPGKIAGKGGIGLENIRKRLDLIYGKKYDLYIDNQGDVFKVSLRVPVTG